MFHQELFIFCFHNVYDFFQKFLFNQNTEIAQHALVLISEVFYVEWHCPEIRDWVKYLLPLVLKLSSYDDTETDGSIINISLTCLDLLACRGLYEETILLLLEGMAHENENLATNASKALFTFITKCEKGFLADGYEWNGIFDRIFALWVKSSKRPLAEGFVNVLKNSVFSQEGEFEDLLSRCEDDVLQNLLMFSKFNYNMVRQMREAKEMERQRIKSNAQY
jgi:hypothetical protein